MFTPERLFTEKEFDFEPIMYLTSIEEPHGLNNLKNLAISFLEGVSENFNDPTFQYLFEKDDCLNELIKLFVVRFPFIYFEYLPSIFSCF